VITLLALAASAAPLALHFPVACKLGETCAIQNYRDDDPGSAVKDYACGKRTYDGHDGTDIRLTSMALERRGVNVMAAAAGTVLRMRDGMEDVSIRERAFKPGNDCGNGVIIDHGGGWETQYCHMARGSVVVRPGQKVAAGAVLGHVGLSGNTEFPHLHITVRQNGKAIDPFAYGQAAGQCRGGRQLWTAAIPYKAGGVLVAGFSAGPVTMKDAQDQGDRAGPRPGRATPLVAYVQAIGLEQGDVQKLTLKGPDGATLADNDVPPLDRAKAEYILFTGRKARAGGWPAGTYRAQYQVTRGGRVVISRTFQLAL